jgi:2-methylcitrate dehydratase PrpD
LLDFVSHCTAAFEVSEEFEMASVPKVLDQPRTAKSDAPLAANIARTSAALTFDHLSPAVVAKAKVCLLDLIGCAFEARDLPWSRQARELAAQINQGATVIGADAFAPPADAAFANAVMGHGLVREDMHSGSISHLGIVVWPALLALAQTRRVSGANFITAAVLGYEVGGQIGRALMDAEMARIFRPTGVTGPTAAAAAGARLLGLNVDQSTSAVALAANTTSGYNQWAHTGGSEMFFQAGFAARNAVSAVQLAAAGAFASPSALDGVAGMFAALGKPAAAAKVKLFQAEAEILSVYHKPVPACNFAQTPCQAALKIARTKQIQPERIAAIVVRVPRAGAMYPGCDFTGPFAHILQAKMSIQYNVAAALLRGAVSEENFTLLNDARLRRLIGLTVLQVDDELTRAYPNQQGGEVKIREVDGTLHRQRLADVVNATEADVRARFRVAAEAVLGRQRGEAIEHFIDTIEASEDVGALGELLRGHVGQ